MTKLFLVFLISLLFLAPLSLVHPHAVNGEENHSMVDILDPELRKRVAASFSPPKAPTDPITANDMKELTVVLANGPDIRHLRGLEHAINLTRLQLLRPRPGTQPELLARPFWRTADLAPISGLTELESLQLHGVVIFDMSPLADLTNLKDLGFQDTYGISRIPDLPKLTALVHLRLQTNRITDISGVPSFTNLRQLDISGNTGLADVSPLTQLSNLEILRLDNNPHLTHESLSDVLSSFSTEVDQEPVEQYSPVNITSGTVGLSNTNISDLSVLDSLPNVFLHSLHLRFMGTSGTTYFHLKDLTPLVDLMNKGKVINGKTTINLEFNYGLDYESLYEDIPALLADTTGRTANWPKVGYHAPNPMLEREFPKVASYEGSAGHPTTFKVRAINTNPGFRYVRNGVNRQFAKVPVTWKVTAPDGTVSEQKVPTGDDGLSSFTFTLGNDGEMHTLEAIVPAKTTSGLSVPLNPNYPNPNMALSHEELKVTFTATAVAPPTIILTLQTETVTQTSLQWIAEVSGRLPEAYVHYYKRSADRDWIEVGNLRRGARIFSFVHFELQPGTWYDFQLFALKSGRRFGPGSNVLRARTLLGTETSRRVPPPEDPPVDPPVEPPVDPPVDPPVEPPVDPPVEETPEQPSENPHPKNLHPLVATLVATPFDLPVEPSEETPVDTPVGGGGSGGGGSGGPPLIPLGTQSFIFNEIGNFSDDTNDWIELKNVCNTPLDLSEWQLRLITNYTLETGVETAVVSFPDFLLPPHAVLLVTNMDPNWTRLASGLNIGTGARSRGAQHPYFVTRDLRLPSTAFLLILQHTAPGNGNPTPTLIDVAGNLFLEVLPDGSEVYFDPDTQDFAALAAPLTDAGVYQRQRLEVQGYLAAAWLPSGYRGGIGYDRRVEESVALGTPGYRRDPSPSQPVAYRLVFNEIRNASDDTHDWIELKNVCGAGVRLRDWHISIVHDAGGAADEEVSVVSFPDYALPEGGVLLITNTDPSETVLADGLNIATDARQHGAQHSYLVAPKLKLPETPYLLILEEVRADDDRTIADVAGNYAFRALPDGTEIDLQAYISHRGAPLAPLARFGAWQRRHFVEQPGYLATAWQPTGYRGGIGYDRYAPAAMCLGTPGYRHDPSPVLPETQRLVFNKIHNAAADADNYIDWIELKNVSDADIRLREWEISSVASAGDARDEDVSIVQLPDWTLPVGGVLLILNTDLRRLGLEGRNIATDTEQTDTEQTDAQRIDATQIDAERDYFVAPDLILPETPYLLILRHAREKNGTPEAVEDVAGDYFRSVANTQIWPLSHTLRPGAPAVSISEAGTWQRSDARQRGYLATAWTAIVPPLHLYGPDAFAELLETQRLAFNKIRNATNDTDDWIELKNISDTAVRLNGWRISIIASTGENVDEDVSIVWFPDWTLPVNGVLLITNTEPDETVLVDGLNITPDAIQQRGAQHPYLVAPNLRLPETPYLLILRHAPGKNDTSEAIEDMAGDYFRTTNTVEDWLLSHKPHPSAPVAPLSETGTYQRKDVRQRGYLATAWTASASPPGISDTQVKENGKHALFVPDAQAAAVFKPTLPDEVRISELMFEAQAPSGALPAQDPSGALPEWIELYNASATPVDLEGYQLVVETRTDTTHRHATLTLNSMEIPPKQTVLLINGKGTGYSRTLPPHRVYNLAEAHPDVFRHHRRRNTLLTLLSRDGFFLQLIHPTGRVVDTCGTLDGDPTTEDLPTWTLPDSKTHQGHRSSLLRRFDGDVRKGTETSGWMPALGVAIGVRHYYGHPTDISTPGFLHQIVPGNSPTVALSISELMFSTQTQHHDGLPQWIELYNPSFTEAVNLEDYRLVVETRHAGTYQQRRIDLEAMDVLPNQTVLLITKQGRHSRHFTENRIYNLFQRHRKAFRVPVPGHYLLSSDGFLIQLTDAIGNVVDTVGNLDGYPFTEDTPAWALPEGETSKGARASIRRLYEKRIPLDGRYREAWVSTATAPPATITYYGHTTDVGNPGYRKGGPLPVVLSRFRAVRDAAAVVVSWTTESSLENAGFHLYRSAQRKGGFIRVNPKLIQGAGTTAERRTYTYVDNPPKADVVYYYQLQEISYSGAQQVLATVRIKGHLSADGKHLTTLGALKTDE